MFVQTHDIDAIELRDSVAEVEQGERQPVRLRVVHDIDREREAQAVLLRLVLAERPAELRVEAVLARLGDIELARRAVAALVEDGLLIRVDEYLLATSAAVGFNHLRSDMAQAS
jgi:hypothetical protein